MYKEIYVYWKNDTFENKTKKIFEKIWNIFITHRSYIFKVSECEDDRHKKKPDLKSERKCKWILMRKEYI